MLASSTASWRVISMIAALFVMWAIAGRFLKLRDPFSQAMFTTTPWLAFSWGHAAPVR